MKICTVCKEEKPISCFYKSNREKDGRQNVCIECKKAYYQNNKEHILEHRKTIYQANKEQQKVYNKVYYQNNKEKIKVYRQNNKEKIKVYNKTYQSTLEGKEVCRNCCQRRRARKRELINDFTPEQWLEKLEYYGHRCAYCLKHQRELDSPLEQDHFIPLCKGGGYTDDNIVPACRSCNCSKGGDTVLIWLLKRLKRTLL